MKNRNTNSTVKMVFFLVAMLSITTLVNANQGKVHKSPKGLSVIEWNDVQQQINQQKFINDNENNKAGTGANYTIDAYIKASNTDANDYLAML